MFQNQAVGRIQISKTDMSRGTALSPYTYMRIRSWHYDYKKGREIFKMLKIIYAKQIKKGIYFELFDHKGGGVTNKHEDLRATVHSAGIKLTAGSYVCRRNVGARSCRSVLYTWEFPDFFTPKRVIFHDLHPPKSVKEANEFPRKKGGKE